VPWWQTIRAYVGGAAGAVGILALALGSQLFQIPSGQIAPAQAGRSLSAPREIQLSTPDSGAVLAASTPNRPSVRLIHPPIESAVSTPVAQPALLNAITAPSAVQLRLSQAQSSVAVSLVDFKSSELAPSEATPTSTQSPAPGVPSLGSTVPPEIMRWGTLILKYAGLHGLDPNLVAAVMMTESGGNPNATSSKGAIGLMQVVGGSYDPETNISQGSQILANDLQRFNGDLELALSAYNAGAHAVDAYSGIPPYLETENYVFAVLNRYYLYSPAS